jgi:hypothetical protein
MSRPYRPPSKRRLQLEAWMILVTLVVVGWCFVGGVYLGLKSLVTLAKLLWT